MRSGIRVLSIFVTLCLLATLAVPMTLPASADQPFSLDAILPQGYVLSVGDDGVEHGVTKGAENGLCIFYLLADGSFLIYDGGQGNPTTSPDAHHLMSRLKKVLDKNHLDDEEIRVSAWVFTHAHKDHMGFADIFFSTYSEQVQVEEFWFNAVPGHATGAELLILLDQYYPDTPVRRLELGEHIRLPGVDIDVLCTPEALGYDLVSRDENAASLVMMLTLGTKRVLMTGDASPNAWNWMIKQYPAVDGVSKLKCDYLQVPHHGAAGSGTDAAYALIQAEYLVIPAGEGLVEMTVRPGAFCYWKPTADLYARYDNDHKFIAGWHDPRNSAKTAKYQKFVVADGDFVKGPENLPDAVVRTEQGSGGLRFISRVSNDTLKHLEAMQENGAIKPGAEGYTFGTLICKEGTLDRVTEFTVEALEAAKAEYVEIPAVNGIYRDGEGLLIFAALVNISNRHRFTNFAATSYVDYHLVDGRTVRVYAEFDVTQHSRSLHTAAMTALTDLKDAPTQIPHYHYQHAVTEYPTYQESIDSYQTVTLEQPKYSAYTAEQRRYIKILIGI